MLMSSCSSTFGCWCRNLVNMLYGIDSIFIVLSAVIVVEWGWLFSVEILLIRVLVGSMLRIISWLLVVVMVVVVLLVSSIMVLWVLFFLKNRLVLLG